MPSETFLQIANHYVDRNNPGSRKIVYVGKSPVKAFLHWRKRRKLTHRRRLKGEPIIALARWHVSWREIRAEEQRLGLD